MTKYLIPIKVNFRSFEVISTFSVKKFPVKVYPIVEN